MTFSSSVVVRPRVARARARLPRRSALAPLRASSRARDVVRCLDRDVVALDVERTGKAIATSFRDAIERRRVMDETLGLDRARVDGA